MMTKDLNFDKKRNRVKYCPCGKSNRDGKFAPYVGYNKKGYCHSCGETFLPSLTTKRCKKGFSPVKPILTSYHDSNLISKHGRNFKQNNFVQFLKSVFDCRDVQEAIMMYCIGTSKYWPGANIFWQIDQNNKVRHGKVMLYDQRIGKRSRNDHGNALINSVRGILKLSDFNLTQCLFGLHLINEYKSPKIALVEGEKTAIIMSIFKPEYLWMATGGKGGFKYEMLKPIKDYRIIAFPDKSEYDVWQRKAMELNSSGFMISVNDWIESKTEKPDGTDLADIFLDEVRCPKPNTLELKAKCSEEKSNFTVSISQNPIPTNTEKDLNQLASKNSAVWLLVDTFGLTDSKGNKPRKLY